MAILALAHPAILSERFIDAGAEEIWQPFPSFHAFNSFLSSLKKRQSVP
jgi:hypothetical protein